MIKDRLGNSIAVGDFLLYVTKTESPSIQFAWVEEFKQKNSTGYHGGTVRIKIAHAEPDGTRKNKTVFAMNPDTGSYAYQDTGKPSIVWLESYGDHDNRFMKFQPI